MHSRRHRSGMSSSLLGCWIVAVGRGACFSLVCSGRVFGLNQLDIHLRWRVSFLTGAHLSGSLNLGVGSPGGVQVEVVGISTRRDSNIGHQAGTGWLGWDGIFLSDNTVVRGRGI